MTSRATLAVLLTLVLAVPALAGSGAAPAVATDVENAAAEPVAAPALAPGSEIAAAWEAIFAAAPAPEAADGSTCCVSCDSGTTCGVLIACCVNRFPPGRKCCQVP